MANIIIPEELRNKARSGRTYWDAYFIDVYLKDGRVFRNLAAIEGVCITGRASANEFTSDLPFVTADIKDIEPHYPVLYNFITFLFWVAGCLFRFYKPSTWERFDQIQWAPSRFFRRVKN